MNILKALLGILLCIVHVSLHAGIPSNLLSANKFIKEIRTPLNNKILQMRQNFIEVQKGPITLYKNSKGTRCKNGAFINRDDIILKISKSRTTQGNTTREVVNYFGCSKSISFQEIFLSKAKGSTNGNLSAIQSLQNDENQTLELTEGTLEKGYELLDNEGDSIFKVTVSKKGKKTITVLYFGGEKTISIAQEMKGQLEEILYYSYPINLNMSYFNSRFKANVPAKFDRPFRVKVYSKNRVEYFNNKGRQVSFADFQERLRLRGIAFMVDSLFYELPTTKFINAGNNNNKLLEELRNAQAFLLSGTNTEYVKNLINEYIKAAEDGEILDNR